MVVRHQEGSLLRKAEQPSLELSTSTEPPIAIGNTSQLAVQTLSDAAPISCQLLHLLLLTSAPNGTISSCVPSSLRRSTFSSPWASSASQVWRYTVLLVIDFQELALFPAGGNEPDFHFAAWTWSFQQNLIFLLAQRRPNISELHSLPCKMRDAAYWAPGAEQECQISGYIQIVLQNISRQ